ncbi:helix-turn-helix domain-containing protein [Blautia sp.]|uniref:helix-turn-helix domain-containing protein n=1 Tax=Blautia sp. TaxID=1955243 RepID=UPI003AB5C199
MEFLTTTEIATKWNISRRRVAALCKEGRIDGAVLKGKTWLIPDDAIKPDDPRHIRKAQKQNKDI